MILLVMSLQVMVIDILNMIMVDILVCLLFIPLVVIKKVFG